jgi:hypothetical protein
MRAFVQVRQGCTCWYCAPRLAAPRLQQAAVKPVVVPVEKEWRPADSAVAS